MKSSLRLLVIVAMVIMVSCGKQIPDDIIQPVEMENLLYDYHLAITMGNDLNYEERYKRELYKEYVFNKHGVTEELFDSSMVWYTRNSKELTEIYKKLQKRFEMAEDHMRTQLNRHSGQIEVSLSGDSVDVWSDRDLYWLTSSPLTNKLMFDLKADTTFHVNDVLNFSADFSFLTSEAKSPKVVAALNVVFKNDSMQSVTKVMDKSGYYELVLRPDSALEYKTINGFIYFSNPDSLDASAIIRNIRLMRYRGNSYNHGNVPSSRPVVTPVSSEDKEEMKSKPVADREENTGNTRVSDRKVRTGLKKAEIKVSE